ncbi:MAG TPA: choice-of-anchor tandem repeat GloVer-containing protein [Candidatus Binatia bacterium]|nr:choice-of-anchor tandem repeat GloVer-containing protein [Candidatus Binatia bacterium]
MNDGAGSYSPVILDAAGNIYGMTENGGENDAGTVFELTPSMNGWIFSLLYGGFSGMGGSVGPSLAMDAAGNLYGTTRSDGIYQKGSVFKLTHTSGGWAYTSLHDFTGGDDGALPYAGVAFDANGNIYGTASQGGMYDRSVVWEITP